MADVQQHPQQYFPGADANEATRPPIEPLPYSTQDYLDEIVRVKRSRRRKIILVVLLVLLIGAAVAAAVVLKLPGSLYTMASNDMKPSLEQGQVVYARQQDSYAKDDIVLFKSSSGGVKAKRVLAKPGEWVNVANDGTVTVSAQSLETPSATNAAGSSSGSASSTGSSASSSSSSGASSASASPSASSSSTASGSGSASASSTSANTSSSSSSKSATSPSSSSGSGIVASRQVPSGYYYLGADSSTGTLDALSQPDGFVENDQIIGKVTFSVWPITKFGPVQ